MHPTPKKCKDYALYLLGRREHTCLELERKLLTKGFARNDAITVITDLANQSLQSDRRFATSYVRMRINRGYGAQRLCLELRERGVAADIINDVLESHRDEWHNLAAKARHKKFGPQLPPNHSPEQQKQIRFLHYRGFSSDEISAVLRQNREYQA